MSNMELALESKLRRLESLQSKGYFSRQFGDDDKIDKLNKEIKKIEDALVSGEK